MIAIGLLLIASFIGSGILFQHRRWLTYIAMAGILFEAQWLLLALIHRQLIPVLPPSQSYLAGSILFLLLWGFLARKLWKKPFMMSIWAEIAVLIVLVFPFASAVLITQANTYQKDGSLTLHGFYNGDTATFTSLVQSSLYTSGVVNENPFASNGYLEYPTLLHGAVSDFLFLLPASQDIYKNLPLMTLIQVSLTIPLFFLLWDVLVPEPIKKEDRWFGVRSRFIIFALQAIIVGFVVTLSFDTYVYPQSHFFLTGIYLLAAALLAIGYSKKGKEQWLWVITGSLAVTTLLFSNAVTGTAALVIAFMMSAGRSGDFQRSLTERIIYIVLIPIWVGLFILASAGDATFGLPGFSYTAALDMLRLAAPTMVLLGICIFYFNEYPLISRVVIGLTAAAFFTFIFSNRDIVVANSSRFFYHAILIAFPLYLLPLIRCWYILRRHLILSSTTMAHKAGALGALIGIFLFLIFPAGASVATTLDSLLFQDAKYISADHQEMLMWIAQAIPPSSVVAFPLEGPLTIPAFTGRSLLRSDYWLSPHDDLFATLQKAYEGDQTSQQEILSHNEVNFVVIPKTHVALWQANIQNQTIQFENDEVFVIRVAKAK